ncbi:hypothetical protein DAPPUDRAFT_113276 [Daphnia pulex]|uniref:Uncharacterized protein n=1 Tax=Daphnia pulex TaxID=6669 RepID=E9HEK1_DAPPU|nr:hypothetical protein DAPPUDRAFT_113276 [Daphnia pulex]|eukprot:EFX69861.1 hypothetical protein DAPPUDRAFT_113276 [Daphnia pulex]
MRAAMRACHACCHGERNERLHFTTKYRKALIMRYPTLDIGAENLHRRVHPIIPQRRDILRSTALLKKTFKGNKKGPQKTTAAAAAAAAAAVILSECVITLASCCCCCCCRVVGVSPLAAGGDLYENIGKRASIIHPGRALSRSSVRHSCESAADPPPFQGEIYTLPEL